jgi:gluconate 2-dehydrogenase alpha chain
MGWTGGIAARELGPTGLKICVLERGGPRSTEEDFSIPTIRDELRFAQRHDLMADTAKDTVTVRNTLAETALPMRRLGSFLPGEGVGGAGVHWNGTTWRWGDNDLKVRSRTEAAHGRGFIPKDMPLRDWGVSYAELEPYYDRFEYVAGVSGKAGNLQGKIQPDGNPFEAPRARDYPLPPLVESYGAAKFAKVASEMGYHPFLRPAANASKPYVNPDGARLGQCQYCGFCERFGCESNAKGSPHITVIPTALKNPNVELRTWSWVQKVMLDKAGKKATGVAYVNVLTGEELEQPADLVLLCAYGLSNVHLMLLSGIGRPYDPLTGRGVVGSHYAYQGGAGMQLFFEGESFNPFIATGGGGTLIDDFHLDPHFDRGPLGYIGGYTVAVGSPSGRPISYRPTPPGTPRWGSEWKRSTAKWYQSTLSIGASGAVMPNRGNYLDLDPTYRNRFGQPLMRMTFDFKDNDVRLGRHAAEVCGAIGKAMKPSILGQPAFRTNWSVVPYQSTHNTGGAIMGAEPGTSAVNTWLQSWDVTNVFVLGASAFPHNSAYNPTGPVAALAFRTAGAIRDRYLKRPGMLT